MHHFNFILLLLLLICSACNMQQEITIDIPSHTPVTFIECYLEPGKPARALATRSVGYFEGAEVEPADELHLTLYRNGVQVPMQNELKVDSLKRRVYNFASSHYIEYNQDNLWEMVVYRQEQEIARSQARFLSLPQIEDINYTLDTTDNLLQVVVQLADDPQQENFYRLRVRSKGTGSGSGFEGIWTDQTARDGKLKLNSGPALKALSDTIFISVYHIDKEYYNFLRSVEKARDANYNPFAQPANIEGNLQGQAVGIFTAVAGSKQVLILKR